MRLLLLAGLSWMMRLTAPLFTLLTQTFSCRDLILIIGGIFLLIKATQEIHQNVIGMEKKRHFRSRSRYLYLSIILQIMCLDIIFSLDSVITAIGLAQDFITMALAIIIAVIAMM